jgi:putative oxidoreductase
MKDTALNGSAAWGVALLRIIVGVVFVAHGAQKLFGFGLAGLAGFLGQQGIPLPTLSAAALIAAEFGGGLALVLGLFTRWAALPLAFAMLVATLTVHLEGGFFLPQGFEYTLTLLAATIALALTGSGRLALDAVLARRSA